MNKEVKKERRKNVSVVLLEIVLLIGMTFSVAYFIHESSAQLIRPVNTTKKISFFEAAISLYKNSVDVVFGGIASVSAFDASDLSKGAYTCVRSLTNQSCQEFAASECASKCDGDCIPSPRKDVSECKAGTCYDPVEGTCQTGAPKSLCEPYGGQWFDDPNGNVQQCKRGCCIVGGSETFFASSQECTRKASVLGVEKEFRPEVKTELECLILSKSQEEGACVFEQDFERTCKFTTKAKCMQQKGEFHSGYLCSSPDLNTTCKKQARASCIEGEDQIYWFDSCGNKENVYDVNKVKSWNSGKVLALNNSCSLGTSLNRLANQETCGNCNYLLGSRCGKSTSGEKLSDTTIDVVCRDLSCVDSKGNKRMNGESWCETQGAIGIEKGSGNLDRSADTPGSRYFRQVCVDGEVRTEACADYRNEICVENKEQIQGGKSFSSAACRINRWQQCLEYNTETSGKKGDALKQAQTVRHDKCTKNPDCFIKEVRVGKDFKFKMCAPKYAPGFSLADNGESAEQVCSMASQTCTVVYVKKISGWKCVSNCECEKAIFGEQLNDFCMSLGDCGASVNYEGELSINAKVYKNKKLQKNPFSKTYLDGLIKYAEPIPNKLAEPGNITEMYGELGIPGGLGKAGDVKDPTKMLQTIGMVAGVGGIALIWAAGTSTGAAVLGSLGLAHGAIAATTITVPGLAVGTSTPISIPAMGPGLTAAGGALAGAAIGVAVVSLLIKFTGIGAGLDPAIAYGLMAMGAVAGAMIGYSFMATGLSGLMAGATILGPILLVAVIVIIVVMKLLGIGKTKKIKMEFKCDPWQPPMGGAKCGECGKDGLPCSQYSCRSLGQTCEFINEGTNDATCVDVSPHDVSAPVIKPLQGALQQGYSYSDISDDGYKIKAPEECLKAYSPITFGIQIDEPAQCRMDTQHTDKYDDMEFDFGGRTLFLKNHTALLNIPSIESLGLPGYDPNRRADYNIYVRCQDKNGNKNVKEYNINFCVKPGDDMTAPVINARDPASEWVRYNETNVSASIYVNEPAECRWDTSDRDYDVMNNSFACENSLEEQQLLGWKCDANLPIVKNETTFYVRCKDQPWLIESSDGSSPAQIIVEEGPTDAEIDAAGEASEGSSSSDLPTTTSVNVSATKKRNKMTQSYQFILKRTASNLRIDSIYPSNNSILYFGVEPASVNMTVQTAGGVNGNAKCSYKIGSSFIEFRDTFGSTHKQVFQSFFSGDYTVPIMCEDVAGNVAHETAAFSVELDASAPKITRVYTQGGNLVIITDEIAQCFISQSKCNFNIENATLMSGIDLMHTSPFETNKPNYIKCTDGFGNAPGRCIMSVQGGV